MTEIRDQPFRFLDLPTELQDRVYNVYLEDIRPKLMVTPEAHAVQTAASGFTLQYLPRLTLKTSHESGLKQTSQKVYRDYEKAQKRLKGGTLLIDLPEVQGDFQTRALNAIAIAGQFKLLYARVEHLEANQDGWRFHRSWHTVFSAFPRLKSITTTLRAGFVVDEVERLKWLVDLCVEGDARFGQRDSRENAALQEVCRKLSQQYGTDDFKLVHRDQRAYSLVRLGRKGRGRTSSVSLKQVCGIQSSGSVKLLCHRSFLNFKTSY